MGDLSATNSCGCGNMFGGNSCTWIIILILLFNCGGNECCDGIFGNHDGNNCSCIIIILLLLFCCGGNNMFNSCGSSCGSNCGSCC